VASKPRTNPHRHWQCPYRAASIEHDPTLGASEEAINDADLTGDIKGFMQ
jgi:hypothetical protein